MFKVVRFAPAPGVVGNLAEYEVQLLDRQLVLRFQTFDSRGQEIARAVTIDLSGYPQGTVLQANLVNTELLYEFHIVEVMRAVDSRSYGIRPLVEGIKTAIVVLEENGDVLVTLLCPCAEVVTNAEEIKVYRQDVTSIGVTRENSPYYDKMWRFLQVKGQFLSKVDIFDSMSYVEAQVDVLTRALLDLLPEGHAMFELLEAAEANSVLKVKNAEEVKRQLFEEKGAFRAAQTGYYEKRSQSAAELSKIGTLQGDE